MSNFAELNSYIAQVQKRLRLGALLRGASVFTGTALVTTVALVLVLNRLAFPATGIAAGRLLIFAALAVTAVFGIALPFSSLTRARAVRHAEIKTPELEHRLTTFEDHAKKGGDPFIELLAADTLARTQGAEPALLVPDNRLFALAGAGIASLGVLVWIIAAGPGYMGYGASLLWTGPKKNVAPLYAISVMPGDATVRRNSDQLITAHITGMQPEKAQLFAHYLSSTGWEPVAMQAVPHSGTGATYQFVFAGLPENVEYYVKAGPLVSTHYKVRVVDLPSVKDIHVIYHYPAWTGMKPVTQEHSGDLRAIEGTDAEVELRLDRPLKDGQLAMEGGQTLHLTEGASNTYQASVHMDKDGSYHLTAIDEGQAVRLSEDYFIATDKAMPPDISISRPGGDYRASPIEEVTVGLKAGDEFGLKDMHLHYSVNGGSDRDVNLLKTPGAKSADGSYTLPLEDYKLAPGDLVSIYATAKDGHSEARTDISFIQVDPFEREFSQSQQAGGGGGSGNSNQTEISKREKELIAATWKQQNDKTATAKDAAAQGQFLSEAQEKLRDQVNALSVRMESRDISEANSEFNDFAKDMQDAAVAMAPSANKLKNMQWKDALPLEQKALQALLRGEATFRQIQVAFGQAGAGGSGGGNAGRDLASLFDLELDTAKNQYETAQTATPAEQHDKNVEDALAKLDALAKRQEDLANQQRNPQQDFQERWQQEMLRREAEELQRQLEQLTRNGQPNANGSESEQSNSQQGSSPQGASGDQSGSSTSRQQAASRPSGSGSNQSGSSSQSSDQKIEQALRLVQRATEAMKRGDGGQDTDQARRLANDLREASNLLAGTQTQLAGGKMDSMAREAERLKQQHRAQAEEINKLANQQEQQDDENSTDLNAMMAGHRERDKLAQERQQLSDALSNLQKNMRDAAREMAPNQPQAAQDLRDALTAMDDSDLDNRVQRTADWLRRGINPNSNGTEGEIAQALDKLSQQLQQAQSAVGKGKPDRSKTDQNGNSQGDQTAVLDQIERLREQLESAARSRRGNGQSGQDGTMGQNGQQRSMDAARLSRDGRGERHAGQNGMGQPDTQSGQGSGQTAQNRQGQAAGYGPAFGGDVGNQDRGAASGDIRYGGGRGVDGTVWNNINTGDNRYATPGQRQSTPADASGNPADTERSFEQEMQELNKLRHMVQADPQTAKDVAELTRQMQHLDPSRFPGNPAIVEQMHQEVLSSIDRLELQLERGGASPEARTGKPYAVPAGYEDSVAEYYKRLSKNPQ
jgi:hypothetical protein